MNEYFNIYNIFHNCSLELNFNIINPNKNQVFYYLLTQGGGQRGKLIPPPVHFLLPPTPFCELSPASRLFSTNLANVVILSRPI